MTRDNGLIVQEVWSSAFVEGFKKITGEENPFTPPLIYYVDDGATEIWESDDSFRWFKDRLLERNNQGLDFFNKNYQEYQELLKKMEAYREKGILSLEELKELVQHMFHASRLFAVLYYSSYDERTPKEVREKALAWREKDELYDIYEKVIKDSLSNIEPRIKGMELVITTDDLDNIPSNGALKERMNNSVFIPKQKLETIKLNEFLKQNSKYNFVFEKISEETVEKGILRGSCAMTGNVRGRVRILRRKNQVSELLEGEILVSPMTTPDFVPAMERAAAIVTDEGGITCHAAIVSREMGKPCVVGTKVATQVLNNGDMVEVNAEEGTVRKL